MKETILFFVALLFIGVIELSQATTCNDQSKKTCQKTLFVTGTCSSGGVCDCTSGYKPGPFGCQITLDKAQVSPVVEFSGQIKANEKLQLSCSPEGIGAYEWFKENTKLQTTTKTLTVNSVDSSHSANYKCKSRASGILSGESTPFAVTVETSPDEKPTVTGMPAKLVSNMKYKLTCEGGPLAASTPAYAWNPSGLSTRVIVISTSSGTNIQCKRDTNYHSAVVTAPTAVSDIDGVEIIAEPSVNLIKGEELTLYCDFTGGFPNRLSENSALVTFTWEKDGATISGQTTYKYTISAVDITNTGSYKCTATVTNKAKKESKAVAVTVTTKMEKDTITASSTGFLKKGHYTLTCNYKTINTLTPVNYTWSLNDQGLYGVRDKTLQFHNPTDDYFGKYACSVTSEDGTVTNVQKTIAGNPTSEITNDSPTIDQSGIEGVGNTLTFSCNGKYTTPGMTYEWHVGSDKQTKEVSKTFKYTPKTATTVTIKCLYSFDSQTSQHKTTSLTPKFILSVALTVDDESVTTLKPVVSTKVKISCVVVKSKDAGTVTYKWLEGSTAISGQTSQYYELTAGTAGVQKTIKCEATSSKEMKSASVTVIPQSSAATPNVVLSASTLYLGGEYSLKCKSESHANGATFEWSKGGTAIDGVKSFKYTIKSLVAGDKGDYTCKITVGGKTSSSSPNKSVNPEANEVACTFANDCDQLNMDQTVCEAKKCKCKKGYTMKMAKCISSSGGVIMASLLMVINLVLAQKLL